MMRLSVKLSANTTSMGSIVDHFLAVSQVLLSLQTYEENKHNNLLYKYN